MPSSRVKQAVPCDERSCAEGGAGSGISGLDSLSMNN